MGFNGNPHQFGRMSATGANKAAQEKHAPKAVDSYESGKASEQQNRIDPRL